MCADAAETAGKRSPRFARHIDQSFRRRARAVDTGLGVFVDKAAAVGPACHLKRAVPVDHFGTAMSDKGYSHVSFDPTGRA